VEWNGKFTNTCWSSTRASIRSYEAWPGCANTNHSTVATLDRFRALSKETRAATNSYVAGILERVETDEAGRRFGKRRTRELPEEAQ